MGIGGGSNSAVREAERAEAERQAAIANSRRQIDQIFGSPQRATDINSVIEAVRGLNLDQLNLIRDRQARQGRFGLARSGLAGGSADANLNAGIAEDFLRGTLQAERSAQGAGSNLRLADEDARNNLLSLSAAGLDATTAAQRASSALGANLGAAQSGQNLADFSNLFGGVTSLVDASRQAQARRRGFQDFESPFRQGGF